MLEGKASPHRCIFTRLLNRKPSRTRHHVERNSRGFLRAKRLADMRARQNQPQKS